MVDILPADMGSEQSDKGTSRPNRSNEAPNLDLYESNTHPFVIYIWLEGSGENDKAAMWRGHITHVPTSQRLYVQDLKEIIQFIVPYLGQMGIEVTLPWPDESG